MGSSTTCSGGWRLSEDRPGPLPRPSFKLTGVFLLVLVIGLTVGWIIESQPVEIAEMGERAPDFSVELIDGGSFTLSSAEGPVVLNFWASWCEPCRIETPAISLFAESNPDVTVIGISVQDTEEGARKFADEMDPSYPLALGTSEVEDAYPAFGLPFTVIIDADGVVRQYHNGIVDQNVLADLVQPST